MDPRSNVESLQFWYGCVTEGRKRILMVQSQIDRGQALASLRPGEHAFAMSASRQAKSDLLTVKDYVVSSARTKGAKTKVHHMFRTVHTGEVTEYAPFRVASRDAIMVATSYSVEYKSSEHHFVGINKVSTTVVSHVCAPKSEVHQIVDTGGSDPDVPLVLQEPDDYCDSDVNDSVMRVVQFQYCHVTRTWKAQYSCLTPISTGLQYRHITVAFVKVQGPEAEYCVSINMFNCIFRTYYKALNLGTSVSKQKTASKSPLRPTSSARELYCAQVNYSTNMSESGRLCVLAQNSEEESQHLLATLKTYEKQRLKRIKDIANLKGRDQLNKQQVVEGGGEGVGGAGTGTGAGSGKGSG